MCESRILGGLTNLSEEGEDRARIKKEIDFDLIKGGVVNIEISCESPLYGDDSGLFQATGKVEERYNLRSAHHRSKIHFKTPYL